MPRFVGNYEVIYCLHNEDTHRYQAQRLIDGPRQFFEGDLKADWCYAFFEPLRTETHWPYQSRDDREVRLYGA